MGVKNNFHKMPENKQEYEVWMKKTLQQEIEATAMECKITCICDLTYEIKHLYRCHDCGIWFCPVCAKKHFGKRPKGKYNYKDYFKENDNGKN